MNYDMYIAAAMGIGVALALMYWTLKDYTYPAVEQPFFDDRRVFGLLAIGMVLGVVIYAVQQYFPLQEVLFALIFAIIYEVVKLLVLNLKRFSRKLDTPFYGLTIGLGMGGTVAIGYIWGALTAMRIGDLTPVLLDFVIFMIWAIQLCLLNGSTGAIIGVGVTKGQPFGFLANAILVHLAYNLVMIGFFINPASILGYVCLVVGTAITAYSYYRVHYQVLPALVKEGVAKYEAKVEKLN
jgi:hypothetical protein